MIYRDWENINKRKYKGGIFIYSEVQDLCHPTNSELPLTTPDEGKLGPTDQEFCFVCLFTDNKLKEVTYH